MNIIISQNLHNKLMDYKLTTIPFGSRAKGGNEGDYDFLHILPDFHLTSLLPFNNKHLLQYAHYIGDKKYEDNVYMTLSQLVHSIVNGDNMFIIEIVLSSIFGNSRLSIIKNDYFLVNLLSDFCDISELSTFNILRGLLGLADRDLKNIEFKKDISLSDNKKFRFVKESLHYFFILYCDRNKSWNLVDLNEKYKNASFKTYEECNSFKEEYKTFISNLRSDINHLSATHKIIDFKLLHNLMVKISKYALINDREVNEELHKLYYKSFLTP